MRPFKMFFGVAIGAILLLFVARIVFAAFIIAALMSIAYAIYRRIKEFITYDRYEQYYIPEYQDPRMNTPMENGVEPLFPENIPRRSGPIQNIQFIEAI